jgi:SAM-dependent methyltransferase
MVAFQGNLCVPGDEDPEAFRDAKFSGFDLAVVGLGFHHFDDPDLAAKRLAARLKPGGVLMIIDFLPHAPHGSGAEGGGHDHHHHHHHHQGDGHQGADIEVATDEKALKTVTHHGFSEERIREVFVGAGTGKDFVLEDMGQVKFGEKHGKRTLFLARGTKE